MRLFGDITDGQVCRTLKLLRSAQPGLDRDWLPDAVLLAAELIARRPAAADRDVIFWLEGLLRHPDIAVREHAIIALAVAKAVDAIPALRVIAEANANNSPGSYAFGAISYIEGRTSWSESRGIQSWDVWRDWGSPQ